MFTITQTALLASLAGFNPAPTQSQALDLLAERLLAFDVQELPVPDAGGPVELIPVRLQGSDYFLELEPFSMRSKDFQLLVQTDQGLEPRTPPPVTTYRGHVGGVPGSFVAASIYGGSLRAQVRLPWGQEFWIQPVDEGSSAFGAPEHVVYDRRDVLPSDGICGTAGGSPPTERGLLSDRPIQPTLPDPGTGQSGLACFAVTDVAFDADFEYFTLNGSSVTNTVNDITSLMNLVGAPYSDVSIAFEITTILVRATASDPYVATDPGAVLTELQSEWSANQQGVKRDTAHLMTGKNLDGNIIGVAFLNAICSGTIGYGVNQARFSSDDASRTLLVAHELGHNWDASHCDGDPGGCGIMCSSLGGCSGTTGFSPAPVAEIDAHRQSRTCLSDVVHVDASSSGGNMGTSVSPYATLRQGATCSLSTWLDRRDVLIQPGAYSEGVLQIGEFVLLQPKGGVVTIQ